MSRDALALGLSESDLALTPMCNVCGWRKGGLHSWDGRACKCGHTSLTFGALLTKPDVADAVQAFDTNPFRHRPLTEEERERFQPEADEARADERDAADFAAHPEDYR